MTTTFHLRRAAAAGLAIALSMTLGACAAQTARDGSEPTSTASTATAATAATARTVVALVVERLETAPRVAAAKYRSGQPVEVSTRERAVLDTARRIAERSGVDPDWVETVFEDQIDANKQAQTTLLAGWEHEPDSAPRTAPDLATEVRPTLDRITGQLVPSLGGLQRLRDDPACADAVQDAVTAARPTPTAVRDALPTAVEHLCADDQD